MIDQDLWDDFIGSRQDKKKPMTDRAINRMRNKLERLAREGHCPNLLLERSIINSWQDVYPDSSTMRAKESFIQVHADRSWADNVKSIR